MKYCLVDLCEELLVLLHNETSVNIFQHLLHGCILNHQIELCFRLMDCSAQDLRNENPACYHRKSAWLPLPSLYSATSYNQARRSTGNMVSTSIMRGVQRRTKGFYRSYFMESSLRDTDWRRDRGKRVLEGTADKERLWRNGTGYGITRRGDRGQRGSENMRRGGWGVEKKGFQVMTEGVILTVGHTLILDLQVLVGPWAGVREDIWTCDHNALGPIVASGNKKDKKQQLLKIDARLPK